MSLNWRAKFVGARRAPEAFAFGFRFFFPSHRVSNDASLSQLSELCRLSVSVPRINYYSAPLVEPNPTRDGPATREGDRDRVREGETKGRESANASRGRGASSRDKPC